MSLFYELVFVSVGLYIHNLICSSLFHMSTALFIPYLMFLSLMGKETRIIKTICLVLLYEMISPYKPWMMLKILTSLTLCWPFYCGIISEFVISKRIYNECIFDGPISKMIRTGKYPNLHLLILFSNSSLCVVIYCFHRYLIKLATMYFTKS